MVNFKLNKLLSTCKGTIYQKTDHYTFCKHAKDGDGAPTKQKIIQDEENEGWFSN